MKLAVLTLLVVAAWVSGCQSKPAPVSQPATSSTAEASTNAAALLAANPKVGNTLIVTPEAILTGRVVVYNEAGRFVVLDFPIGHLPPTDKVLFIFRKGLKIGEVKVTGPSRDHNTVADLTSGEADKGDEVRDR